MNVAWFGHKSIGRGDGLVTYSKELTEGLKDRGAALTFFYHSRERSKDPYSISLGALGVGNHAIFSSPSANRTITTALKRNQIEMAHASLSFSLLDFSLPKLCHKLNIPIVATLHFPYDKRMTFWAGGARAAYLVWSFALNDYDQVIVFSSGQKDFLASFGVDHKKISVIPNGVNEEVWSPGESSYKKEIGAGFVVCYMGRIDPEKNVEDLCEAFVSLNLAPDYKLVIMGKGSELEPLKEKFACPQIIFTGLVGDVAERVRILRGADIFVLPSDVEGMSLSLLEAMSVGCASIATSVGSDGEVLDKVGIVVDPKELKAQLPLALKTLIDFPDFRRTSSALCRERVCQSYSLSKNIDAVLNLYQELL